MPVVHPALARYRSLLARVDQWFGRVAGRFPAKVTCHRGCHDCCLGAFDVTALDAALLREGLAGLPAAEREDIRARASEVLERGAAAEPRLAGRATLAGLSDGAVDAVIDALGPVRCPVLGEDGACRLYEHRPLICRLNGVPIVDTRGRIIQREGCFKNSLAVGDAPASEIGIDYKGIRKEEERLLEELGGDLQGRFIAQVVA